MGSSAGEAENGCIDETVGGLVWVRRRNGSWWPGQIISVDELPKSSLLAAKPGTPVKLLGRDDASIDWYNLNKSKRVKEFRCGEFDNCIEKAKAAVSTTKKSVKYARREDAIISALEIENSYGLIYKDNSKVSSSVKKQNGNVSTNSLVIDDNGNAEGERSAPLKTGKVAQELSHLDLSSAETDEMSSGKPSPVKGKRRKTPNDSEDDGVVGVKRMRGIKDLVLDVASKIKDEVDEVNDPVSQDIADKGNSIAGESLANSEKSTTPSLKKKRSAVANSNGHESKRRKDRRRTLTRVLENSVMVSVPVICNELSGTVGSQPLVVSDRDAAVASIDSEGITSDYTNNYVDGTDDQSENAVISNFLNVAYEPLSDDHKHKEKRDTDCLLSLDDGSLHELYDVHLSVDDDNAGLTRIIPTGLSGKMQTDCTNVSPPREQVKDVLVTNGEVPVFDITDPAGVNDCINNDIIKSSSVWHSKKKRNSRRTRNHKKQDLDNIEGVMNNGSTYQGLGFERHLGGFSDCSDLKIDQKHEELAVNPEDGFPNWGKLDPHREITEGDVDEAKGPTRSLPYRHSRLVVPSKYEEADFPTRNTRPGQGTEPCLHDVQVEVEVKATSRSHHVPIVSFMSKFNGKAIVGHPLTVIIVDNGYSDDLLKHFTDNLNHKSAEGRGTKKHSKSKSGSKKGLSKSGGSSSKKTKKLSSLTTSRKSRENDRNPVLEKPTTSAIACIPLNVVFSRLNEAVNGSKQRHLHTLKTQ